MVAIQAVRFPVAAMTSVVRERRSAVGFGVVALWAVLSLIGTGISLLGGTFRFNPQNFPEVPPEMLEQFSTVANVATPIFAVLSPFVWWLLVTLVMQLATSFFGGEGTLSEMFAVVGVACVPFVIQSLIGIPLAGLQIALGPQSSAGAVIGLLVSLLGLAFVAWHVALIVVGASLARRISYGQSGGSCAVSCAGCGGLVVLLAVLVSLLAAFATGLAGG